MAWYPHFMMDYARDTQHLSLAEHGAYRLLLDHYYDKKLPLPTNEVALYRICRALTQFFNLETDGWHQKRADQEIVKAKQISAIRSQARRTKGANGNSEVDRSEGAAEIDRSEAERVIASNGKQNSNKPPNKTGSNEPTNGNHLSTQITDHNTQTTIHRSQITDHKKKAAESRADEPRAGGRRKFSDDDFIAELQASEAYRMLNVRLIYNRMLVWCNRNQKPATQRRLIGWLNREDIPMGNGNGSHQANPGQPNGPDSNYEFKSRSIIR